MHRTQSLIFGAAVVAAMFVGGVIGAAALARSTNVSAAQNVATAASPTPFKSNEATAHETAEPAAQETAENNGTFKPAGGEGHVPGQSNEKSAHETGESAAREAAENAAKASPGPTTN